MPPEQRNDLISRAEFQMYADAITQLRDAQTLLLKQGFDGVNERLDGVNEHLKKLNGQTARNTSDVITIKAALRNTGDGVSRIEDQTPKHLLKKPQTYAIAGGGAAGFWALIELLKYLAEFAKAIMQHSA